MFLKWNFFSSIFFRHRRKKRKIERFRSCRNGEKHRKLRKKTRKLNFIWWYEGYFVHIMFTFFWELLTKISNWLSKISIHVSNVLVHQKRARVLEEKSPKTLKCLWTKKYFWVLPRSLFTGNLCSTKWTSNMVSKTEGENLGFAKRPRWIFRNFFPADKNFW